MDCQKELFSLPEGHHYLNCAYFSPLMKLVEEAGKRGILQKRTPWTVEPDEFFENSDRLRSLFARLVNVPEPNRIAIMPAASYGLSTVAKNLPPGLGENIVIAGEQFPSNVYPWMRYCREQGKELRIIESPADSSDRVKVWNEKILDAITEKTILVSLGHIHWTDGSLFDLAAIGDKARRCNTRFVIDGTQSVGALPFDVQKIKPDALICAGYKWLMGPYSIALGYFGPTFDEGIPLEEGWINRKNSNDFAALVDFEDQYRPGAIRYDVGERSNFILVPMMIQAIEQLLAWEPGRIQQYCKKLTEKLDDELKGTGFRLEQEKWRSSHLFGIRMPGHIDRKDLQKELSEKNIHVSVRGSAIRVSPHVYNNENDIDALLEILKVKSD